MVIRHSAPPARRFPRLLRAAALGVAFVFAAALAARAQPLAPAALPAPTEWAAPAGFPAAPGDAFPVNTALALTDASPPTDAPVISEWHEIVLPGEAFTLSGIRFSQRAGTTLGTDTSVWLWADTPAGGTLRQCLLPRVEADLLTAIVPDDVPYGLFLVWVENEAGVSRPVCLNRARPTWIGPVSATGAPGSTKRVFGVNLTHQRDTAAAHLYVQPAAGGALTPLAATALDPYAVAFTLPDASGDYRLWVHNGHGGAHGWAGPLPFTVATPAATPTAELELAAGDGVADDSARLAAAAWSVFRASGDKGGTVRLAAGVYRLLNKDNLYLPSSVRFLGVGSDPDQGPATILLFEHSSYLGLLPSFNLRLESLVLRTLNLDNMIARLGEASRLTNVRMDGLSNYLVRRLSADGSTVGTTAGVPTLPTDPWLDGPAASARFHNPGGIVATVDGGFYVADTGNHTIRRIAADGTVSTYAGAGGEWGQADGSRETARFYQPTGLALAPDGALLVADTGNHTIRRIGTDGAVTTLAGAALQPGSTDGPAASARFRFPEALVVAADGTIYVADTENQTIRRISPAGDVSTHAGRAGSYGFADGSAAQARFRRPAGLALAADGTLYVADNESHLVRRIAAGSVSTFAGSGLYGHADGPAASARFRYPAGLALAPDGALLVADSFNYRLRRVAPDGATVSTLAGSGRFGRIDGPAASASLGQPQSIAVAADGSVHFTTSGLSLPRIDAGPSIVVSGCDISGLIYLNGASNFWIHGNRFRGAPHNLTEGVLAEIFVNNRAVIEDNEAFTPAWPVGPAGRRDYENFLSRGARRNTAFAMRLYSGRAGAQRYIARNTTRDMARGNFDSNKGEQILLHEFNDGFYAQLASATADTVTLRADGLVDGTAVVMGGSAPVTAVSTAWANTRHVVVIRGAGIGQFRRITSVDTTANLLRLEQPWRVPPGPGSIVAICYGFADNVVVGNRLGGYPEGMTNEGGSASTGVQLDANALKCFVEDNASAGTFGMLRLDGLQSAPGFWNEFRANRGSRLLFTGLFSVTRSSGAVLGSALFANKVVDSRFSFLTAYQPHAQLGAQVTLYHGAGGGHSRGNLVDGLEAEGSVHGMSSVGSADFLVRRARVSLARAPDYGTGAPVALRYDSGAAFRFLDVAFSPANATFSAIPASLAADLPAPLLPAVRVAGFAGGDPVDVDLPLANLFTVASTLGTPAAPDWIATTVNNSPLPALGAAEGVLTLRLDPAALDVGAHTGLVSLTSASGRTFAVGLRFELAPLPPLGAWRRAHFGSTATTPTSADLADPDGDGANNLLEYALARSPLAPERAVADPAALLPVPDPAAGDGAASPDAGYALRRDPATGRLTLTFRRARAELTYVVETCADLAAPAGSPSGWQILATNPGAVGELVTVPDTLPAAPGDAPPPRRFLRLRVSSP